MQKEKMKRAQMWIRNELGKCVDFWLKNGIDEKNGGVYTCLDREGEVFSTDKSVWMQGRCAWTFAWLCNVYGKKAEWIKASKSCLDFMDKYCFNPTAKERMYFTVTEDGKPLRQRRHFYSESFYAIANAEYYAVTKEKEYLEKALKAYNTYLSLYRGEFDCIKFPPKTEPSTRAMRNLGLPMICLNITNVLARVDKPNISFYDKVAEECVNDIFQYHYRPELNCTLENVGKNGELYLDVTEGRIVNPGHDIEAVWFVLEYAKRKNDKILAKKAEDMFNCAYRNGWDKEFGGLLSFVDALGNPPEHYEHDMKLWWPHNELLISSLMLYKETEKEEYIDCFFETLLYCKEHFADEMYGEWYGYLRRDGKPTQPACKGSTFKGPFHLPRMLSMVDRMIEELLVR